MRPERNGDRPEILGRLRTDAEERVDERRVPRWARVAGWLIAGAIVVVVVIALVAANPL